MTDREHEQFEHVSTPAWFRRLPRIPMPRTSQAPRPEWQSPEEKTATRLADAHLEILSLPWKRTYGFMGVPSFYCPCCGWSIREPDDHESHCAWLIAARACGVA